jgi:hypothetical protein
MKIAFAFIAIVVGLVLAIAHQSFGKPERELSC